MTRDELLALAARVKALTAPSRVIDAEIMRAVFGPPIGEDTLAGTDYWWKLNGRFFSPPYEPDFTASLDASLLLKPQGSNWSLDSIGEIYCAASTPRWAGPVITVAATPALALTAAFLEAHGDRSYREIPNYGVYNIDESYRKDRA
jgi:hypothetical protein